MAMYGGFFSGFYQLKPESGRAKRIGSHGRPPVFSIIRKGERPAGNEQNATYLYPFHAAVCKLLDSILIPSCDVFDTQQALQIASILRSRRNSKDVPFRNLDFSYLPYFYHRRTATRLPLATA